MMQRAGRWARASGGAVRDDGHTVFADSGGPVRYLNEVISTRPLDGELAARALAFFGDGRDFVLSSPRGGADLSGHGLALEGHPPFLVRPPGGTAPALPAGVTVHEVTDPAGLRTWAGVLAAGFGMPPSVDPPPALLGGAHRFWLARRYGEPVATAAASVGHGVVDVETVATVAGHRRRGIGEAVTWAATLADPALPAVLLASDPGRPVYQRMGYLPLTRWTMWHRG
jgi:hypothetical protein